MKIERAQTLKKAIAIAAIYLKRGRSARIVKTKFGYEVRVAAVRQR